MQKTRKRHRRPSGIIFPSSVFLPHSSNNIAWTKTRRRIICPSRSGFAQTAAGARNGVQEFRARCESVVFGFAVRAFALTEARDGEVHGGGYGRAQYGSRGGALVGGRVGLSGKTVTDKLYGSAAVASVIIHGGGPHDHYRYARFYYYHYEYYYHRSHYYYYYYYYHTECAWCTLVRTRCRTTPTVCALAITLSP